MPQSRGKLCQRAFGGFWNKSNIAYFASSAGGCSVKGRKCALITVCITCAGTSPRPSLQATKIGAAGGRTRHSGQYDWNRSLVHSPLAPIQLMDASPDSGGVQLINEHRFNVQQ